MRRILNKLIYSFFYVYRKVRKIYFSDLNILADNDTIHLLKNESYSMSRFGDGEFQLIFNKGINLGFQSNSKDLAEKLEKVLVEGRNIDKLLIGVPRAFKDDKGRTLESKLFWAQFVVKNFNSLKKRLDDNLTYCDASITRPYIAMKNKNNVAKNFESLKSIWDKKYIVIVEGENTLFGVNNDLLENAQSVERIICPNKNAYDKYDEIVEFIVNNVDQNKMILMALGPTASILAVDLAHRGYQAIDIGHIDIEYEWFLRNAKKRIDIQGKFTNEVNPEKSIEKTNTESYVDTIIKTIL